MKKILFVLVAALMMASCSNGSHSNDEEPVYTPVVTSDATSDSSTTVEQPATDYYTCDYWYYMGEALVTENTYGPSYIHYEVDADDPLILDGIHKAGKCELVYYDENGVDDHSHIYVGPIYVTFNNDRMWLGCDDMIALHKVGNDYCDDNNNIVFKHLD